MLHTKSFARLLLAGLAACAAPVAAHAEGTPAFTTSFSLTGSTDYVWRGFSQTNQNPAVFATVSVASNGFYLGAGTENVKFANIRQEYDIWGGYARKIGPVTVDLGFVRYGYVDAPSKIDTLEGKVQVSGDIGKVNLHVAGFFTGNYFGTHKSAQYYEVGASMPLGGKFSTSAAFGRQEVDLAGASYNTWNLGIGYALAKNVSLDVRYHDTDTNAFGDGGKSRVTGGFTVAF